ncbi:peptidase S8/S53 domain-containing protein [Mycena leptocephala]|nr:peptidase S8/S53 domain-containing protein [Mycena leptocephala]
MHLTSLIVMALASVAAPTIKAAPSPESAIQHVLKLPSCIVAQYCAEKAMAAVATIVSIFNAAPKSISNTPDVGAFTDQTPLATESEFVYNHAPWTLARLVQWATLQPGAPGMGSSATSQDWRYPLIDLTDKAAENPVVIYVLDLGIRETHHEFGGRVVKGLDWDSGDAMVDVDGHGTAVAGSAAGATLGSAPLAQIISVKIANNRQDITTSRIAEGVDLAIDDYLNWQEPFGAAGGIIQLSIETHKDDNLKRVFENAIRRGIHIVTGAGNKNANQCDEWIEDVGQINVGAIDIHDHRAHWQIHGEDFGSNFGPCVDLYAGGDSVRTAGKGDDTQVVTEYGTSFAAPQVAGIIANKIFHGGNKSPADMKEEILADAIAIVIDVGQIGLAQLPPALIQP